LGFVDRALGAAVFYVNADASSIQVPARFVDRVGAPFAVPGASVPGQQFTVSGAAAGNYVLSITTTVQPTSVVLDGAAIKVTGVVGTGTYQSGPLTLTAGTHTVDVTPATNSTIAATAFVPQSGAELGFLQTSGG